MGLSGAGCGKRAWIASEEGWELWMLLHDAPTPALDACDTGLRTANMAASFLEALYPMHALRGARSAQGNRGQKHS